MADRSTAKNKSFWIDQQAAFTSVVSTIDPGKLEDSQIPYAKNAYVSRSGRITKRNGFEAVGSALGGTPRAERRYISEDGSVDVMLVWERGNVWSITDAGVATQLVKAAGAESPLHYDPTDEYWDDFVAHDEWAGEVFFSERWSGLWKISVAPGARKAQFRYWVSVGLSAVVDTAGTAGNAYTVTFVNGGASKSLSVSMAGTAITVNLATNADSVVISTANEIAVALNGNGAIGAVTTWTGDAWVITDLGGTVTTAGFWGGAETGDVYASYLHFDYTFRYLAKRSSSERLFGIDDEDPTNVRWCDSYDAMKWNALSAYSPGGVFTAMVEIGDVMVLAMDDRLFRIDGSDPATWVSRPAPSDGIGVLACAPDSLVDIEGVAVFLSARGLAYYDGNRPQPLSAPVFNTSDSARSLLPVDQDLLDGAFCVDDGEYVHVFFKSASTKTGCDRALVLDFRNQSWGGPYHFGFEATCGCIDISGTKHARKLTIGAYVAADGKAYLARQTAAWQDLGSNYEMHVKMRKVTAARPALDKIFPGFRVGVYTSAATTVTARMLFEDAVAPVTSSTNDFVIAAAGNHTLEKRMQNIRAKDGHLEVLNTANVGVEIDVSEVDLFFVLTR